MATLFGQVLQLEDSISLISQTPDKFQSILASFVDLQKRVNSRTKIEQNLTSLCLKIGACMLKSDKF